MRINSIDMRVVIQRVSQASVTIGNQQRCAIGKGLLVLVGVGQEDDTDDIDYLVKKTAALRIFDDEAGVMNRSVVEAGGDVIVVSQFTLMASTRKGNRPSYIAAAGHETAVPLYEEFCRRMSQAIGRSVGTGVFGADMKVSLVNDGPVTICIDSKNRQ